MKKFAILIPLVILGIPVRGGFGFDQAARPLDANLTSTFRIGWISALTGPVSKYGAFEAAQLAVQDINAAGGVRGLPLELVVEDGRCDGATTASAAHKLIDVDRVRYILGGHCSTETMALAPIAERAKVLTLASITSTPALTGAGRYILRTSPVSTLQSDLLANYLADRLHAKSLAILNEDTSYVGPIAKQLQSEFEKRGGKVVLLQSFNPGTNDFRSLLTKAKSANPDALFLGVQAQDTGYLMIKQARDLGLKAPILGNEAMGNAVLTNPGEIALFEDLVFGEAAFDPKNPLTSEFINRYNKTYKTTGLPYGIWTAETYDGVRLLANRINKCGDDVEAVRKCLVGPYSGVSGTFEINSQGDGVRDYRLKVVRKGKIQDL